MLIAYLSICINVNVAYAESHKENYVVIEPILGDGYMVLDKQGNHSISNWYITFIEREYGADGNFTDVTKEKKELKKECNYIYVPVEFRDERKSTQYFANIDALNDKGEIISTQHLPLNGGEYIPTQMVNNRPFIKDCGKVCIGYTYAYSIDQYSQIGSTTSKYHLANAYREFQRLSHTANPYYYYVPFTGQIAWHGTVVFNSGPNANVTVRDISGRPIIGLAYGSPKELGPWEGQDIWTSDGYSVDGAYCNIYGLQTGIDWINNTGPFSDNRPPLECKAAEGTYVNDGPNDDGSHWSDDFDPDYYIHNCLDAQGNPLPYLHDHESDCNWFVIGPSVLNETAFLQIKDVNHEAEPIIIDFEELNNITFKEILNSLEPSLYSFGFMSRKGVYTSKMLEIKSQINKVKTKAEQLNIEIYPTPMSSSKTFKIVNVSKIVAIFNYELIDFEGALLHSEQIKLGKGQNKNFNLKNVNIRNGIIFHKFIFEDGSTKVVESLKN